MESNWGFMASEQDRMTCRRRKPLAQILLLDQGRSMKRNLDTGIEVYDNKVKQNQRHTTNEKPNMYLDIFNTIV